VACAAIRVLFASRRAPARRSAAASTSSARGCSRRGASHDHPHAPFELLLYGRDGRIQIRQYENLLTAVAAIDTLRPALVRGYTLSIVLHTGTLPDLPELLRG
jgi:hypothetical protein